VVILSLVSAHYRFATERHWHTVRLPLRIPITVSLVILIGYMSWQSWVLSVEHTALYRAQMARNSPAFRLAQLKAAMAADGHNFETAFAIGEYLRLQSWEGGDNYRALAQEALTWFKKSSELNPYNPQAFVRLGMCADWLDDHAAAAGYFETARKNDPNGYLTRAYMGWHFFQIEDMAKAKKWFEDSLSLVSDPGKNPIPYSYLTMIKERGNPTPTP